MRFQDHGTMPTRGKAFIGGPAKASDTESGSQGEGRGNLGPDYWGPSKLKEGGHVAWMGLGEAAQSGDRKATCQLQDERYQERPKGQTPMGN